ncbi:MAG: HAMP domain-containing histidine kinase [Oscillospiraceae bacterium]|nr:HAMP domain-containing histidine kinase [Oscillospiraceae bacterium]
MIRTLRRKFTVTAMIAVTVLLLAILGAVNGVNAWTKAREADQLLDTLVDTEGGGGRGPWDMPADRPEGEDFPEGGGSFPEGEGFPEGGGFWGGVGFWGLGPTEDSRMSALFFTVTDDGRGSVSTELNRTASVSEEEAASLYASVGDRTEGRIGAYLYRSVTRADGSRVTVFLDRSRERADVLRVAAMSALAGLLGWGLMLLFVMFLSKKAIEPVAQNMEKQKRFVTDAGHELKTPLAIILANTEAMELRQGESKYTKNIRGQVERLSGLTQNLLALARADEGHKPMDLTAFSLGELAEETARPFREPAELKGLSFSWELADGVEIRANRAQIGQLISILLDNAVKYSPEGGAVLLRVRKEGGKALLQVKNTVSDRSVPAERLFDRFYRADAARTQKSGGYGIGLSAARAIAEAHRGSLSAAYEDDAIVFTFRV